MVASWIGEASVKPCPIEALMVSPISQSCPYRSLLPSTRWIVAVRHAGQRKVVLLAKPQPVVHREDAVNADALRDP